MKLTPLDRDTVRTEEHDDVAALVAKAAAKAGADPVAQASAIATAAAPIVDKAADKASRLRGERDAVALSLALYDGPRDGLHLIVGVNRTRWYEMRHRRLSITETERRAKWLLSATAEQIAARAAAHGVDRVPVQIAEGALPRLALETYRYEERAKAARALRDQAVHVLLDAGWKRTEIAPLIGKNESRISHIKSARLAS
jgi:hypothetical protein